MDPLRLRARLLQGWEPFDRGFKYEIGLQSGRQSTIPELIPVVKGLSRDLCGFAEGLAQLTAPVIDELMTAVPLKVMGTAQREFATRLVLHRKSLLETG